ncbi:hypothetical protein EYF80_002839 [Liparis tanakae]|uniref:Uncharacterized protein n=1 Tax=Liparis tanakae TaxID=230148 RepID=A0A4Z2JB72_9TELE|nr:hypothetical protein EYF80_002839 [Liparis tanakae]
MQFRPGLQRWPMGFAAAVPLGLKARCMDCGSFMAADAFSSSLFRRHAAFGFRFLSEGFNGQRVQLTHVTQLLERLVDVPHTQTFAGVVGHPPVALPLGLLLRTQIFVPILMDAASTRRIINRAQHTCFQHCPDYSELPDLLWEIKQNRAGRAQVAVEVLVQQAVDVRGQAGRGTHRVVPQDVDHIVQSVQSVLHLRLNTPRHNRLFVGLANQDTAEFCCGDGDLTGVDELEGKLLLV